MIIIMIVMNSISPHRLGVVLAERKDLKRDGIYLLVRLPKIILMMKRMSRKVFNRQKT